jgi:hypothetical protein
MAYLEYLPPLLAAVAIVLRLAVIRTGPDASGASK